MQFPAVNVNQLMAAHMTGAHAGDPVVADRAPRRPERTHVAERDLSRRPVRSARAGLARRLHRAADVVAPHAA